MILNQESGSSKPYKKKKSTKKKSTKKKRKSPQQILGVKPAHKKPKKVKAIKKIKKSLTPVKKGERTIDKIDKAKKAKKKKKSTQHRDSGVDILKPKSTKKKKKVTAKKSKPKSNELGQAGLDKGKYKAPVKVKPTKKKKKVVTSTKPVVSSSSKSKPVVSSGSSKKPVTSSTTVVPKKKKKTTTKVHPIKQTPVGKGKPVKTTTKAPAKKPAKAPAKTDWSKYTPDQLNKDTKLRGQYIKANPTSSYTKDWETKAYNKYNDMIMNNKPMTPEQQKYYNNLITKWSLDDYNDVNVQHQARLKQDKDKALGAEDVALNKSLSTMDAQAFQEKQQMQQDMATRGITDSGIAADAYARAQALNGANYSQAYADSAKVKSDINAGYTDALNQSKQAQAEAKAAQEAATAESINEQLKLQTEQDKYLTSATGFVYLNGKVLKDRNGNPLTSLAYQKMLEDNRHNVATESAQMQKINNDLALATQKLEYNWASLDLRSQEAQANIANAQAKLEIAARNADTAEVRTQAGILNNELKSIQKQIDGYKKSKKPVPGSLKKKLKKVMTKMDRLASMGK